MTLSFPARGSFQNNSVQHLVSNSGNAITVTKPATQPAEGNVGYLLKFISTVAQMITLFYIHVVSFVL